MTYQNKTKTDGATLSDVRTISEISQKFKFRDFFLNETIKQLTSALPTTYIFSSYNNQILHKIDHVHD
jgi:hypothetical protein